MNLPYSKEISACHSVTVYTTQFPQNSQSTLIMNISKSTGIEHNVSTMYHIITVADLLSSFSGSHLLRLGLSDPTVLENVLQMISFSDLLTIHFCCKALESKKLARLKSELLGEKSICFHKLPYAGKKQVTTVNCFSVSWFYCTCAKNI